MIQLSINNKKGLNIYLAGKNIYELKDETKFRYRSFRWFMEGFTNCRGHILAGSDKLNQDMYKDTNSELLDIPHIIAVRGKLSDQDLGILKRFTEVELIHPNRDISATQIKQKLNQKEDLNGLISAEVLKYILERKIYSNQISDQPSPES